ncbi:condensin subunit ScpA [Fibrobacter sp. UWR3]|uniref:segregation/condensation protein A n=1 Tax=Fibrobacter sp. UWR3 TaxID=1896217 RepID=UPI000922D467|nr:segregation/condensation protein A [Fibrobacter sp. UWR3]SHM50946.1 condensin subunit ScpA [Fibrobacter sp. UWR3]
MTEIEEQEDYEVRIGSFNGPMDLLVYLVQKKEMSLDQIPIAEIADDFLAWVNKIGVTDLSKAGDFLYMASRLMALKVQELLPAEERDPELVEEYNADREKLMQEMLEYQRYKQVAGGLQDMEGKNFGTYSRGRLEKTQSDEDTLADANIWQLFRAYQKSLKTKISDTVHHIELDYVTIQDRQQAINNYLSVNGRALFEELLDNDSHPIVAAVTFMALLEMIKTDEVVFRQSELFGPIWIYRKKNNPDYADEMARETVFYSKDPDVKPGLVEEIRNMALARSQAGSVGDIAAVMKEAVLWTTRGREVTEENLQAMLEGREDLSEVQENPFAEMMKEDDAAENAMAPAEGVPTGNETAQAPVENTPADGSTGSPTDAPVENVPPTTETVSPVEETASADKVISSQSEPPAETEKPAAPATSQMSDEEFEAFMKKAQAFYDTQAEETTSSENIAEESDDDDDDFPSLEVHSGDD